MSNPSRTTSVLPEAAGDRGGAVVVNDPSVRQPIHADPRAPRPHHRRPPVPPRSPDQSGNGPRRPGLPAADPSSGHALALLTLGATDGAGEEWARRSDCPQPRPRTCNCCSPPGTPFVKRARNSVHYSPSCRPTPGPRPSTMATRSPGVCPPRSTNTVAPLAVADDLRSRRSPVGASAPLVTGWGPNRPAGRHGTPAVHSVELVDPHLLLSGRVPLRRLLPAAIATGIGLIGLRLAAGVYLSTSITQHVREYGPLATGFILLSWLTALHVILLGSALLGAVLEEHRPRQQPAPRTRVPPAHSLRARHPRQHPPDLSPQRPQIARQPEAR